MKSIVSPPSSPFKAEQKQMGVLVVGCNCVCAYSTALLPPPALRSGGGGKGPSNTVLVKSLDIGKIIGKGTAHFFSLSFVALLHAGAPSLA